MYQSRSQMTKATSRKQPVRAFPPFLEQDSLDGVIRVTRLSCPAGLHLHEHIRRKCLVGLQTHLHKEEVVAPQSDDSVVGAAEWHVCVQRHGQLQRGVELHHWESLQPAGTTWGLIKPYRLPRLTKHVRSCVMANEKRLPPLHGHTDLSVANVVSRVNTNPDDLQIPPADDFLRPQTNTHSIFKLKVCSVHLDNQVKY